MVEQSKSFIAKNWGIILWVILAIFAAGGLHSEFRLQQTTQNAKYDELKQDISVLHRRLSKKVEILEKQEKRIEELEKHISWERGVSYGRSHPK